MDEPYLCKLAEYQSTEFHLTKRNVTDDIQWIMSICFSIYATGDSIVASCLIGHLVSRRTDLRRSVSKYHRRASHTHLNGSSTNKVLDDIMIYAFGTGINISSMPVIDIVSYDVRTRTCYVVIRHLLSAPPATTRLIDHFFSLSSLLCAILVGGHFFVYYLRPQR